MRMIVNEGTVYSMDDLEKMVLDRYGYEWIIVDASSEDDAIAQADAYDMSIHPAQTEMVLFREMIRGLALSGDTESALSLLRK